MIPVLKARAYTIFESGVQRSSLYSVKSQFSMICAPRDRIISNDSLKILIMGNFSGVSTILALGTPILAPLRPVGLQAAVYCSRERGQTGSWPCTSPPKPFLPRISRRSRLDMEVKVPAMTFNINAASITVCLTKRGAKTP